MAIGNYDASRWIGDVDVPTALLRTDLDRAITPDRQQLLADATRASVYPVNDGHIACGRDFWLPDLLDACRDVAARAGYPPRAV